MAKLSVWSLWLSSALTLLGASALGAVIPPDALEQGDLKNPSTVAVWLKANGASADKARVALFFEAGLKEKKRSKWGPAEKGFVASALLYPAPNTLIEYANAVLHSLGAARAREKTVAQYMRTDMIAIESIYRSALAADAVLNTLSATEKKQIGQNADCLSAFIKSGENQIDCQPLQAYGLK